MWSRWDFRVLGDMAAHIYGSVRVFLRDFVKWTTLPGMGVELLGACIDQKGGGKASLPCWSCLLGNQPSPVFGNTQQFLDFQVGICKSLCLWVLRTILLALRAATRKKSKKENERIDSTSKWQKQTWLVWKVGTPTKPCGSVSNSSVQENMPGLRTNLCMNVCIYVWMKREMSQITCLCISWLLCEGRWLLPGIPLVAGFLKA